MVQEPVKGHDSDRRSLESLVADVLRDENAVFENGKWVYITRVARGGRVSKEMKWRIIESGGFGSVEVSVVEYGYDGKPYRSYSMALENVIEVRSYRDMHYCFLASSGRLLDPTIYGTVYMDMGDKTRSTIIKHIGFEKIYSILDVAGEPPSADPFFGNRNVGEIYRRMYRGHMVLLMKDGSIRVVGDANGVVVLNTIHSPGEKDLDRGVEYIDRLARYVESVSRPGGFSVSGSVTAVDYVVEDVDITLRKVYGSGDVTVESTAWVRAGKGSGDVDIGARAVFNNFISLDDIGGKPEEEGMFNPKEIDKEKDVDAIINEYGFNRSIIPSYIDVERYYMWFKIDLPSLIIRSGLKRGADVSSAEDSLRVFKELMDSMILDPVRFFERKLYEEMEDYIVGRLVKLGIQPDIERIAVAEAVLRMAIIGSDWSFTLPYIVFRSTLNGDPAGGIALARRLRDTPEDIVFDAFRRGDIAIGSCSADGCDIRIFGRKIEELYPESDQRLISRELAYMYAFMNITSAPVQPSLGKKSGDAVGKDGEGSSGGDSDAR